jgi:hypothetical protein
MFSIYVSYTSIKFRYTWLIPASGLRPNATYDYLNFFGEHARRHIKKVCVSVEFVDSYKGMIKYNCGGKGLSEGVRRQVQKLVVEGLQAGSLLADRHTLRQVVIRLEGNTVLDAIRKIRDRTVGEENVGGGGVDQSVLVPFGNLRGVGHASVRGMVDDEYARDLERKMMSERTL